jgi:hypothetical protein
VCHYAEHPGLQRQGREKFSIDGMRTQRLKTGAFKSKELATRPARRVFRPTAPRAVHDRSLSLTRDFSKIALRTSAVRILIFGSASYEALFNQATTLAIEVSFASWTLIL